VSLAELGALGEFVGSIAVVASLLFLALQLRSNTTALRAATYQSIHDAEDNYWADISNNPKLARIWRDSDQGFDAISDEDLPQAEMLMNRLVFLIQNTHYQRTRGFVDDEMWHAWDQAWIGILKGNMAMREMYERNRGVFNPEFERYSQECIERGLKGEGGRATLS